MGKHKNYLFAEKECLTKLLKKSNKMLEILALCEIVNPARAIFVRFVNASPHFYKLKISIKVRTLKRYKIHLAG